MVPANLKSIQSTSLHLRSKAGPPLEAQTEKILLFSSQPGTCISQQEPGATHLPRSHRPGPCHAGRWNSRSRCRMAVPRRRKVATGQETAGPSWPGWWQCQDVLDEAGPGGNCREKENKLITEAPLGVWDSSVQLLSHPCITEKLPVPGAVLRAAGSYS